jgi:hypothetical protein
MKILRLVSLLLLFVVPVAAQTLELNVTSVELQQEVTGTTVTPGITINPCSKLTPCPMETPTTTRTRVVDRWVMTADLGDKTYTLEGSFLPLGRYPAQVSQKRRMTGFTVEITDPKGKVKKIFLRVVKVQPKS